jgi:hypothetical protein
VSGLARIEKREAAELASLSPLGQDDLDGLERIAREAGDEPWRIVEYGCGDGENLAIHEGDDWRVCFLSTPGGSPGQLEQIAAWAEHIAAFDPPTALRLISELRSLRSGGGKEEGRPESPCADAGTHIPRSPEAPCELDGGDH